MSNTCAHLDRVADAVNNYNIVVAYYVTCLAEEGSKRKAADAHCHICKSSNRRIHACLECAFFGCFDQENGMISHIKDHALKNEHYFAININHGCLFCFECDDYIYNESFEDIFKDYKLEARRINGSQSYLPWKPKADEIALLKNKIKKISDDSYIGLRGLVNIGNSCYVNCIIQVFMHNPVLRDFFLSDKHRCFLSDCCLTCEMFVLFQEFYSGISVPFLPSKQFFGALQKFCKSPLGIDQQDTHELLQEILIGLHTSCQKTHQTGDCNCMIHQIFYGINQSFKECSQCKALSLLPLDHFMDILLNLDIKDDSLVKILNRKFLEPQLLLSDLACSTCKQVDTTHLYQTIKKLPTVICFRMNFFNWDSKESKNKKFQKKSTAFAFEEWIDMSPYLNSKGDFKLSNGNHTSNSCAVENRYCLFAVIFHKGDLQGGHYSTYVRQRCNRWYECDDTFIYKRSLEEVLKCEPFLLFYYKQL